MCYALREYIKHPTISINTITQAFIKCKWFMTRREGKTTFTVFIIDDDKLVLDNTLTRIGWQENGFEVVGSNTNPSKAVDEINLLQSDVVISDLVMPGLDGVGVFQKLKPAGVRSRFVMLTGLNAPAAKKKFYSLGGFEYLMKPFNRASAEPALERLYLELTRKEGKEPINTLVSTGQQVFDDLAVYIASHLNEDHTLSSLSSRWDIPEERICALFAEHYQSSLKIFVKKARMREAARLLAQAERAEKEISGLVGFSNYYSFAGMFLEYFGVTPSEYRKAAAN